MMMLMMCLFVYVFLRKKYKKKKKKKEKKKYIRGLQTDLRTESTTDIFSLWVCILQIHYDRLNYTWHFLFSFIPLTKWLLTYFLMTQETGWKREGKDSEFLYYLCHQWNIQVNYKVRSSLNIHFIQLEHKLMHVTSRCLSTNSKQKSEKISFIQA